MVDKKVKIGVEVDAKDAVQNTDRLGNALKRAGKDADIFGKILGGALERIGHHITDTIARAPGAIADLTRAFADSSREAEMLARTFGGGINQTQALLQGFKLLRINTDASADAIRTLQENLGELERLGTGPAKDSLGSLGLTLNDFAGKDVEERVKVFAEAIKNVGTDLDPVARSAKQTSIILEVMGGSAEDMIPALQGGRAGLDRLTDAARRTGNVMDTAAIAKSRELDFTVAEMQAQLEGTSKKIAIALLPRLQDAAEGMQGWIDENDAFISRDLPGYMNEVGEAFVNTGRSIAFMRDEWNRLDKAIVDFSNKELDNDPIIRALFGDRTVLAAGRQAGADPSIFQSTAGPEGIGNVALQEYAAGVDAINRASGEIAAKQERTAQTLRGTLFELDEIASQHQGGARSKGGGRTGPSQSDLARQQFAATKQVQDIQLQEMEAFGLRKQEVLDRQLEIDLQHNKSLQLVASDRLELTRLQDEEEALVLQHQTDRRIADLEEKKHLMDLWLEAKSTHEQQIAEIEEQAARERERQMERGRQARLKHLADLKKADDLALKRKQEWLETSIQLNSTAAEGALLAGDVFIKGEENRARFTNRARGAEAAGIGAIEAVKAAAAYASGNIPGGVAHTAAAVLAAAKSAALFSGALDPSIAGASGAGGGVSGGSGGTRTTSRSRDIEPGEVPISTAGGEARAPSAAANGAANGPPTQIFVLGNVDDDVAIKIAKAQHRAAQRHGPGVLES